MTLGSCTKDLPTPPDSIELSASEITLSADQSISTIEVRGATANWSYILGAEWLKASQQGNTLQLKADPNYTGRERKTTIVISSGADVANLIVKQSADGSAISIDQDTYNIDQWGGEFVVPVKTTVRNWEVLSSENWLQVYANRAKGELVMTIKEHTDRQDRRASIIVRDPRSRAIQTLQITQRGILYMLLPYLGFGEELSNIQAFERARRSELVGQPGSTDKYSSLPNRDLWKFKTHSPLFTRVEYRIPVDKLTEAYAYCSFKEWQRNLEEIKQYILSQGFEERSELRFYSKGHQTLIELGFTVTSPKEGYIRCIYEPAQSMTYPSFEVFPAGLVAEEDWTSYTKDRIHTWETNHQGETSSPNGDADETTQTLKLTYFPKDENSPLSMTQYTLSTQSKDTTAPLMRIMSFYVDDLAVTNKFFWEKDGAYYLTEEFMALAKAANFAYSRKDNLGKHIFYNNDKKVECAIKVIIPVTNSGLKPFVTIEFTKSN